LDSVWKGRLYPRWSQGEETPFSPSFRSFSPIDTDMNAVVFPGRSILLYPTLSLHGEYRYGHSGRYVGEPGDLQEVLRGMPDIQAQHSCTVPARHTLLRTRNITGPAKSKNDGVLLPRVRNLYRSRARHRVLLRQTVKEFFFLERFMLLLPGPSRFHRMRRARYCIQLQQLRQR
jgi:hypothetical protein